MKIIINKRKIYKYYQLRFNAEDGTGDKFLYKEGLDIVDDEWISGEDDRPPLFITKRITAENIIIKYLNLASHLSKSEFFIEPHKNYTDVNI